MSHLHAGAIVLALCSQLKHLQIKGLFCLRFLLAAMPSLKQNHYQAPWSAIF